MQILFFYGSFFQIPRKNHLEHGAHKGLDKKQLGKESKRKVETHKAKPLNQCDMDLKAVIIGIIKESYDKAHSRNHQADCRADYCRFKQNRVCRFQVKVFRSAAKKAVQDWLSKLGKWNDYKKSRLKAGGFIKNLDGRRIHHIRFPFGSAGCLSCSSNFTLLLQRKRGFVKFL